MLFWDEFEADRPDMLFTNSFVGLRR